MKDSMTPQEAAALGYAVITDDTIPRGTVQVVPDERNHTGRPLALAHSLDYIALAWPDPEECISRQTGWYMRQGYPQDVARTLAEGD